MQIAITQDNSVLVALLSCDEKSSDMIGQVPCVDLFLLNRLKFTLAQLGMAGIMDTIEYLWVMFPCKIEFGFDIVISL